MPYSPFLTGFPAEEEDPRAAQVKALLSQLGITGSELEFPAPPQAPQTSRTSQILGPLGDAIRAMAAVRAGGTAPPIGAFAAGQREQQAEFEKRQFENEQANRTLRNQIRIGLLSPNRATRFQATSGFLPRTQMLRDEEGNVFISATQMGTEGVGETVLKNVDPRGPAEPVGSLVALNPAERTVATSEGIERFDPRRGTFTPTGKFPPPSEETQQRVGSLGGFRFGLDQLKKMLPAFIESRSRSKTLGVLPEQIGRVGQQVARRVPLVGPQVSDVISTQGEDVGAVLDRVRADYTRMMSGLQASELEQARLLRTLPDLGTKDAATVLRRIENFEASVRAFARERARLRPDLFQSLSEEDRAFIGEPSAPTKTAPSSSVDDLLKQYEEEFGATSP